MARETSDRPVPKRFFGDLEPFSDFFAPLRWESLLRADPGRWAPPMDIVENEDAYTVTMELPGAKREDVSIEAHENMLTIKGEKRSEHEEKDEYRHCVERSYGSFSRTVRLPADASDQVKARFADGVLTVEIPKAEERKPRVVAIQ